MDVENRINTMQQAEYYNQLIWTVFSVGIALALYVLREIWPYKTNFGFIQVFEAFFGYLVLFYCTLTLESFGQKKRFIHLLNDSSDLKLKTKIDALPFTRTEWVAEIILGLMFLSYILVFLFNLSHQLLIYNPELTMIIVNFFFLLICVVLLRFVVVNWLKRPTDSGRGNLFERMRISIAQSIGFTLKDYNQLVK